MSEASRLLDAGSARERALLRAGADEEPSRESMAAAAEALGLAPRALLLASLAALLSRAIKGTSTTKLVAMVIAPAVLAGVATVAYVAGRAGTNASVHVVTAESVQGQAVQAREVQAQVPSEPVPAVAASLPSPPSASALPSPQALVLDAPVHAHAHASRETTALAPSVAPDAELTEQVRLVDRARALVAAGDPSGALAAVNAYDRRFARGVLAEEAALVRIQAVQAQGNHAQAASLARQFVAQYPKSVHRSKIQWLLGDGAK